jgi:hypothetical protein
MTMRLHVCACAALCAAAPAATAQSGGFTTPGMPVRGTPRAAPSTTEDANLKNAFNPDIGFVFDIVGDYVDVAGSSRGDGLDLELRVGEMTASAWVDPTAFAYASVVYAHDEVALEEGAVRYEGFGHNLTLTGGRFFVDFGKQMQAHVHDLRTVERPAVLANFLGDELAGDGVQLEHWFAAGDATVVRSSLAAFGSLIGEGPEEDDASTTAGAFDDERKEVDELAFTARVTGFSDVGENSTLQVGASTRVLPEFGLEAPGSALPGGMVNGLSNTVFGVDVTFGWKDDTQTKGWTFGGEGLLFAGDIGGAINDNVLVGDPSDDLVAVVDDDVFGLYVFADHAWNRSNSAGAQWSHLELPEMRTPRHSVVEAYYTHQVSEFQRVRVAVSHTDEQHGRDSFRLAVQWTAFLGPHSHGVNW